MAGRFRLVQRIWNSTVQFSVGFESAV